jgi:hypothetical protein
MVSCHACGEAVEARERVAFRAVCDSCGADLYVCLNCRFHDPGASKQCREPEAELVVEKERGNRCEWFQPGDGAGRAAGTGEDAARAKLEALFRKPGAPASGPAGKKDPKAALDALFKKKKP